MFSMLNVIHLVVKPHKSLAIFLNWFSIMENRVGLDLFLYCPFVHSVMQSVFIKLCKLSDEDTNLNEKQIPEP